MGLLIFVVLVLVVLALVWVLADQLPPLAPVAWEIKAIATLIAIIAIVQRAGLIAG